ncbi:MAG: 16S rRNA (guanine(966)-N(2))-methyltransferase RsmD [Gammaproteobacteria bacterium]|nr:16S rRNA (guanine(966)-N(2))-methyltransferase RsmD [Gammaproteobacteria bacterium]
MTPRNNRPETPRTGRFAKATNGPAGDPPTRRAAAAAGGRLQVRIIGGEWRGRKLHFPQSAALRPTPDRVRETVFNWLQFELAGARCLDLFAGSGALGIEALSRGAREVVFAERDPASARAIGDMLAQLRCDRGHVEQVDALAWLERGPPASQPFDIVFLDPPYGEAWLPVLAEKLERGGWLAPRAWIYLEDAAARGEPALPPGWTLHRSKRAGDVGYHLARRGLPAHNNDHQARGSE